MNVLHIINSLEIGGAQKLLTDILPLMKNSGVNVSLLVLKSVDNSFDAKIRNSGIQIYSLNCKSYYNPLLILRLFPLRMKYQIIHVHLFPALYWVALTNLLFPSAMLFFTEHSTNNRRRGKKILFLIERFIYGQYKRIISISPQTQSNLKEWLNAKDNDSRFVQISNGVNLSDFFINNEKKYAKIFDVSRKTKIVLMISRFSIQKDHETVIRAIPHIVADNVIFVFAGTGPTIEHCQRLARELGVLNKIIFLGQRDDIPELISASYIGVQSSFWEGFGLTAVEFMAGKKPVIASNVAGLKQVVEGAGLLFPAGNEKYLAYCITRLLIDKQYYNQISERCFNRAFQYDIHMMVEKYIEEYKKVLSKKINAGSFHRS